MVQKRSRRSWRGRTAAGLAAAAGMALALAAVAQPQAPPRPSDQPVPAPLAPQQGPASPVDPPAISTAVERLLKAEYLTEDERKDRRLFHGVWEDGDLDTPARTA